MAKQTIEMVNGVARKYVVAGGAVQQVVSALYKPNTSKPAADPREKLAGMATVPCLDSRCHGVMVLGGQGYCGGHGGSSRFKAEMFAAKRENAGEQREATKPIVRATPERLAGMRSNRFVRGRRMENRT